MANLPPNLHQSVGDDASIHDKPIGHHPPAPDPDRVATSSEPDAARRMVMAIVAITVFLLVAFLWTWHEKHAEQERLTRAVQDAAVVAPAVDVVKVEHSGTAQVLTLPGEARAFYESTIYARVNGYLQRWRKDFGDSVKKDDVLATILTPELDADYEAAKAKLNALRAEAHVAAAATAFAQVSYDRWEAANRQLAGAVSEQERDQKKTELASAKAKQEEAEAQVRLGQAEADRLETLQSFKKVTAPYDGVVTARSTDIGDLVTSGSASGTKPLFRIAQYDQIRVWVDVPQVAVPQIHLGMKASATARELPNKTFLGVVDRTAQSIDPGMRTLRVEVLVKNPPDDSANRLLPGMYLTVTFKSDRASPPLRIPAAALVFGPGGPTVGVVSPADNRLTFRSITILRDLGDAVEIDGINDGDQVALNIGSQAVAGQVVEPHPVERPMPATTQPAGKAQGKE